MKKLVALMLSLIMVLSLAACGSNKDQTDLEAVKENGVLVVGVTDYAPMDYKDENNEWIGFDADMARAFAKKLGVKVDFVEIKWENKLLELNSGAIDCVWNGMTLNAEVKKGMDCSNAYCNNSQVVIVPVDKADQYQTLESIADLKFAVEAGSAGKDRAAENELEYKEVPSQANALLEVASQTSDAAIIDAQMAKAMVGDNTDYADLTEALILADEKFGVGFRKGSDLVAALNDFLVTSYEDGTMMKYAKKYGIETTIIPQK